MPGPGTYWHTLRHLKPVQFYGRAWFRLSRPRPDLRQSPQLRSRTGDWAPPAVRQPSLVGDGRLCFLNESRDLAAHGWDDPSIAKLWRYNLHYFDDLNALAALDRIDWHRSLLTCWVRENPAGVGTAWEPYPTSIRIVNWIKWALAGSTLPESCCHSLAVQARWLMRRIEIHLLGNHLLCNAKALVFAGLYFEGGEAQRWLEKGLGILRREVPEQILSDGGHFELSPMYHALALEDLLDLCNIVSAYASVGGGELAAAARDWRNCIERMRHWLSAMCHPDGDIGYFNDAASGIAPDPAELERYAVRLGFAPAAVAHGRVTHLAASGYVRVEHDDAVALLDVAPVGPDYLPAHAHADTLSFEMSLFGVRLFVNSGTSCYGLSAERLRQRSTAAHNTVEIDGESSSEVWGAFRVGRRARPYELRIDDRDATLVRCAQDGYAKPLRRREHEREWRFDKNALIVEDRVSGRFERAQARFHLHPSVSVLTSAEDAAANGIAILEVAGGRRVRVETEGAALRVERSTWHPEFGRDEPNVCLTADFCGPRVSTRVDWSGAR